MRIDRIDHVVLTVADIQATCDFYETALGMKILIFGDGRRALGFGDQKINLHQKEGNLSPKPRRRLPVREISA